MMLGMLFATTTWGQDGRYDQLAPDEFMRHWWVLGPITPTASEAEPVPDGETVSEDGSAANRDATRAWFEQDFLATVGGEVKFVPGGAETVRWDDREFAWKTIESTEDVVDLGEHLSSEPSSAAYAAALVEASEAQSFLIGLGSDDGVRVWLNGELVHDHWVSRPVVRDQDLIEVTLPKGPNRLLLKIFNQTADWGFACRRLSPQSQVDRMIRAAGEGAVAELKTLLAAKTDVNGMNQDGMSPWLAAAIHGHRSTARLLEEQGARPITEFDPAATIRSIVGREASATRPGVAILVARDDTILFEEGFGMASLEHDVPISPHTKFRIGSVTKQFTAAAILKLQEAGQLSTDDRLDKFFPDFPRGDEVTLAQLLTHTSGIHSYTSHPNFLETAASAITPHDVIASFQDDPFDFPPGTSWAYSNSGYFLLGEIVAKVSGKSYAEFLETTFFDPLGMSDTGVHTPQAVLKHEATGYAFNAGEVTKALNWDMSHAGGAGALYSTVRDLLRWNRAVFGGKVLSEASLAAAWTPVALPEGTSAPMPYGFGWVMDDHRKLKRISHSGGLHGFLSQLSYYPDQTTSVIVLHNASPPVPEMVTSALADEIAELYLWQDMAPRSEALASDQLDRSLWDQFPGQYDYQSAILNVTRDGERWFAQLTGQPRFEIFPASSTRFFWKVVDAQVEFLPNEQGQVTAVQHTQGGRSFRAEKIKPVQEIKVATELLDRYTGEYTYPGIGVLKVRRQDGRLLAQMSGQPEFEIYPKSETDFFWKVVRARNQLLGRRPGNRHQGHASSRRPNDRGRKDKIVPPGLRQLKQPLRFQNHDRAQRRDRRAADQLQPASLVFLQLSLAQRDHDQPHHQRIVEHVGRVVEQQIGIILPSGQLPHRQNLCVQRRQTGRAQELDDIHQERQDRRRNHRPHQVFSQDDPTRPCVDARLRRFGD